MIKQIQAIVKINIKFIHLSHLCIYINLYNRVPYLFVLHLYGWIIYIFIAVATALGVAYTVSDAGLIDCLLVGVGNGALNFFLVERVFNK